MLPSLKNESWKLDAAELIAAYSMRHLDPIEVVDLYFSRIGRINPALNAYVCLSQSARDEAIASSLRWREGRPMGPLDGVPMAVKDNLVVKGMPATFGSRLYAGVDADHDELPVRRLREAGVIFLGKTNTPEFAAEGYTDNELFGVTRNPWAPELTPGGSSGGSVAAVAAGLAPVALGTDGGGSTRRPAAYAGLLGFKPGTGHVARGAGFPQVLLDFEVIGTFTRSARDAALIDRVISGANRADPTSRARNVAPLTKRRLRILHVERIDNSPCEPMILNAVRRSADMLRTMGHEVFEGELPFDFKTLSDMWSSIMETGLAHLAAKEPRMYDCAGSKYVMMAKRGAKVSALDLLEIQDKILELRQNVSRMFGKLDLVLTPACAAMPWAAEQPYPKNIDGTAVGSRGHAVYTSWVNAAGHPAIALPCSVPPNQLPIGAQLIGDLGSEELLLALASAWETEAPWAHLWPHIATSDS